MRIQFQILGPLEVRMDGAAVAIGGPRQRALLAMLLLSANQVVSRDRLTDELLDAAPDGRADRMLTVQASRLRRVLEVDGDEPRVTRQAPGYILRVEPGELDLDLFEQLLAEGHRAREEQNFERASQVLREADSLWRGRPLADLEFERFARIEIERLQELRLTACEERIDAELALGRHNVLIAELEALVGEHPLRERLRGQLMLALYRCGRQADALETYRSAQELLSDELALEPSPALRQLERSILRQEPALELSARGARAPVIELAAQPEVPAARTSPAAAPERHRLGSRRRRTGLAVLPFVVAAAAALSVALTSGPSPAVSADSVTEIDPESGNVRWAHPIGGLPGGIAVGAGAVWVTDTAHDQLLELHPATNRVEHIPVGRGPTGVAVGDGEVWVVNQLDGTVSEINPRSRTPVGSFPVGNGAEAAAYGDGSLWVTNITDDTVSRINPSTGKVKTIPLSGEPGGIAVGRDGVWVTDRSTGQLLLISPDRNLVADSEPIGSEPAGVALGAGNVWVANTAEQSVSRFDPGSGKQTKIPVGKAPVGVAYGAGAVWVADSLDGTVARIDPHSNKARLHPIGGAPTALAVVGNHVWAAVLPGKATHEGGTLTIATGPAVAAIGRSVDPARFAGSLVQWQMLSMTNDGLVTYRRTGGQAGGSLVPDLATSLPTPTDGGRTYTFRLRRGIHYSDGTPVKPGDFRHELERVFLLGNGYPQSFYTGIVGARACLSTRRHCTLSEGITTDDKTNTVTFHLTAPDPDFLYKLAFPWADAVPAGTPNRDLRLSTPPATGPYLTKSITPSHAKASSNHRLAFDTWTLVRNPHFQPWNPAAQPQGYPDRIVLHQGMDPRQAVRRVERGTLDVLLAVPANRLSGLATHYPLQLHSEPLDATYAPVMNTRTAPFDQVLVRRALNYAIDRQKIVAFAGGPWAAQPTCQVLPPNLPGYRPYCPYTLHPNPGGSWTAPNLLRAKTLIRRSGTQGMKVTVLMPRADAANPTRKIGPYLVGLLNRLGYRATQKVTTVKNLWPMLADSGSHLQIGWSNWLTDYPAPSSFITTALTCASFTPNSQANVNFAEFCHHAIDHAAARAQQIETVAPGKASEAWAAVDRRITDEAPWLPLYNPRLNIATASRVGDYQYHPFFTLLPDQLWVR